MTTKLLLAATLAAKSACAQQPTAADIMARVAANQDAANAARQHFVYVQHAKVTSRKGKTVRCEEITDMRVTPTAQGQQQTLLKLDGRVLYKGKYLPYTTLEGPVGVAKDADKDDSKDSAREALKKVDDDTETDRDLVENMRKNLTDGKSKDGLGSHLFPLTTEAQKDLTFTLVGREPRNGRNTFHIVFQPKDKDDIGWKGDAWIDTTAFEPVVIRTAMSRKLPFLVRGLMGINLPGLGFTATYAPEPEPKPGDAVDPKHPPVWFPTSFGTEFELKIFWFFSREIVLSVSNRDFEQTHAHSTLLPGEASAN